ncbi:hypothetical protein A2872_00545 [Candidatus Gottesmanbacteria bacterium RIFCSPHIGHO2_01_FULL_42_12]|uniref:Alpha/beta hydrolase n=1 Tax=Candidatus Gottesmanbacteria bacterium RIFCSPHIGHO2_01_FULL_42_12 TaxID=1798377 RepID=A0A1F5Z322_9BACT|nr:MAG: hypothetical protein A2872_00545 [Candidatus Gottesmanbacteria bacterium RIFCSPHIGHO2_01_FULL_42_12]
MKLLILPGYSPNNKSWAQEVQKRIGGEAWSWRHWTQEKEENWAERETARILEQIGRERVSFIAKSIGTAVAMKILAKIPSQVEKLILNGIPINDLYPEDVKLYNPLANFDARNIKIFQNESDPHGTFAQAEEFIGKINPEVKIISKSRNDHEYPYYQDFAYVLDKNFRFGLSLSHE